MSRGQEPDAEPSAVTDCCVEHGDLRPYCAPPGLLTQRPAWLAPSLLLAFAGVAIGIHFILPRLTFLYGDAVSDLAVVRSFDLPKQASIAVRPLTVALLLLFSLFAAGPFRSRVRLAATSLVIYLTLMIAIDVLLARWARYGGPSPFMARGNIVDGLAGILAVGLAVLSTARLPANLRVDAVLRRPKSYLVVFVLSIAATIASVVLIFHFVNHRLHAASTLPLLGGLFSVVVFFFALFPIHLCLLGYISDWLRGDRGTQDPDVGKLSDTSQLTFGFLVPAHNEEGRIADCISAIDMAAADYDGVSTIYVIENGSTDGTYDEASQALAGCRNARGVLLTSATQYKSHAKAHALNTGLEAATEHVIVRVDADTFVDETLLHRIAPHFLRPDVGGVGTVPLPHKVTTWIERMRSLEVYYGAAFKRTSQGAVDAIPVLPGAAVAFRRDLLTMLHGFSEGIRGEDADVTVRVGRLGYRIVSDPMIRVYSEQPQSLRELREQRMRWSSGLFHMIGRNRSAIYRLQGLRGVWTLPWACFVMFRKLMLIPFAVAALAVMILSQSFLPVREIAAAGAIVLGVQLVVMGVVVAVLGGPLLLVTLPSYMVFRLIVTYFSLETLLTVRLKESRRRFRLPLGRPAVVGIVAAVFAASALTVALVWRPAAGTAPSSAAGPGNGSISRADASRGEAAGWVVRQVARGAIAACDRLMCEALEVRGFPAGNLQILGPSAPDPLGSTIVLGTSAVRSQFGSRLTSQYAPIAIAGFGSGTARVDVLVTAADGAAAYRSALRADVLARRSTGARLLRDSRLTCSPRARAALAAGQVDARLLITLTALARTRAVHVLAFSADPGASRGVPLRGAELAAGGPGSARSLLAVLRTQRGPYLASSITTARLPGGSTVVRVGYSAPSPLGLLHG